ncbi:MAG: hypothetical protein SW019_16005 [Actinomycetota bacterium]|nr:hypothetical protein [Actinomycetota bacterium]
MTAPRCRSGQRPWLLIAGAVGYSAVAVATAPWTLYTAVFTAIPGLVLLGYAVRRGWHRSAAGPARVHLDRVGRRGLAVWLVLVAVLGVWILSVHFSGPRVQYPTLSYLMNSWFDTYAVRVGGFATWLALGWWLVRR